MTNATIESQLLESPPDPQAHRPFPEVAAAIRSQTARIVDEWRGRTLDSMPELAELTVKEFRDDIAHILSTMADALESNEPPDLTRLLRAAPAHGFHRFLQKYELADLFAEERVLRRVIVTGVESALRRRCEPDEAAALHSMIDIMLQQGVLALAQEQRAELRRATEMQLKYLSFLSHDLSNNFLVITLNLQFVERSMEHMPQMRESADALREALATIRATRDGMGKLLEHERLRSSDADPGMVPVRLLELVGPIAKAAGASGRADAVRIDVDIDPQASVLTNPDLVTIILQNLIGNAVKHSRSDAPGARRDGGVRVGAARERPTGRDDRWIVSVADDGPGIPKDQIAGLFDAFTRVAQPGDKVFGDGGGFGLGLAIASQAARLLGTTIEVASTPGQGATFSFELAAGAPG